MQSSLDRSRDRPQATPTLTATIERQVRSYPWMALGAAVAAGYLLGSMTEGEQPPPRSMPTRRHVRSQHRSQLLQPLEDEVGFIKTAAVATVSQLLRDAVRSYMPNTGGQSMGDQSQQGGENRYWREAKPDNSAAEQRDQPKRGDNAQGGNLRESTATNTSWDTGAGGGTTGFDSPPDTTVNLSNTEVEGPEHVAPYYPPGSSGKTDPEKDTPPSERMK